MRKNIVVKKIENKILFLIENNNEFNRKERDLIEINLEKISLNIYNKIKNLDLKEVDNLNNYIESIEKFI